MSHFWVVEFLHSLGWTPYSVHISRDDARAQVKLERRRHGHKFKIRASKAVRATSKAGAVQPGLDCTAPRETVKP